MWQNTDARPTNKERPFVSHEREHDHENVYSTARKTSIHHTSKCDETDAPFVASSPSAKAEEEAAEAEGAKQQWAVGRAAGKSRRQFTCSAFSIEKEKPLKWRLMVADCREWILFRRWRSNVYVFCAFSRSWKPNVGIWKNFHQCFEYIQYKFDYL